MPFDVARVCALLYSPFEGVKKTTRESVRPTDSQKCAIQTDECIISVSFPLPDWFVRSLVRTVRTVRFLLEPSAKNSDAHQCYVVLVACVHQ